MTIEEWKKQGFNNPSRGDIVRMTQIHEEEWGSAKRILIKHSCKNENFAIPTMLVALELGVVDQGSLSGMCRQPTGRTPDYIKPLRAKS